MNNKHYQLSKSYTISDGQVFHKLVAISDEPNEVISHVASKMIMLWAYMTNKETATKINQTIDVYYTITGIEEGIQYEFRTDTMFEVMDTDSMELLTELLNKYREEFNEQVPDMLSILYNYGSLIDIGFEVELQIDEVAKVLEILSERKPTTASL